MRERNGRVCARCTAGQTQPEAVRLPRTYDRLERSMKKCRVSQGEKYRQSRSAAKSSNVPATASRREPIDRSRRQQFRETRHDAMAAFSTEYAGTVLDLDADLEAAGI